MRKRMSIAAAGVLAVACLGTTGATAAQLISSSDIENDSIRSKDIKDDTIRSRDIMNGKIRSKDIKDGKVKSKDIKDNNIKSKDIKDGHIRSQDIEDGTVQLDDLAANVLAELGQDIPNDSITGQKIQDGTVQLDDLAANVLAELGQDGISGLEAAALTAPVTIANIGGPIDANNTDTGVTLTLPAGKYLVTVDGGFISSVASANPDIEVHPQLSLWLDHDGSGDFAWKGGDGTSGTADDEGNISPNAAMPAGANRHVTVSGQTVITLDQETTVGLLAFGYAEDGSSKRSGEIDVRSAVLTATPLN